MGVIASWKQYRDAPKLRADLTTDLENVIDKINKTQKKHSIAFNVVVKNHNAWEKINYGENISNKAEKLNRTNFISKKYQIIRDASEKEIPVLKNMLNDIYGKSSQLNNDLNNNPFMKADSVIRNNPKKIAAIPVVVGGTIYGGKKAIDHLTTPPVVTAPTVAPVTLPPAAPPDIKPPPNHFSDNASKYGVALGGVAAAGLGALALRRYMKKKKDK